MSPARPATGLAGVLQRNLSLLYAAGVLGAFLQISGGTWDVASHSLGIPDTFFTPSHSILYAGVGIAALAGLGGIVLRMTAFRASPAGRTLVAGLGISFVGSLLQGIAGPADFAWHEAFGEAGPSVLGLGLKAVGEPNRYGLPPFYQRHVWLWSPNPLGMYEDWNSRVSCRGAVIRLLLAKRLPLD